MSDMGVGIVGCGKISGIYLKNLAGVFPGARVVACADLDRARAEAVAAEHRGVRAMGVDELLAAPEVGVVLNLTVPKAHAEVGMAALRAGKHLYAEKPLTVELAEGQALMRLAREKKLQVGCAPDTFLGGSHQTCRKLIDDGRIGQPVAAAAFMMSHGPEHWHPSPEFYYERGGGPMFDMGPYYLTALVNLLGPVRRVAGMTAIGLPERVITSEPKRGKVIKVETPTHVTGQLEFASGVVGTITTSFECWGSLVPRIEVYGTQGTLLVPDPNGFGGEIQLRVGGEKEWKPVVSTFGNMENSRGAGVADLAQAVVERRLPRASGDLALHVLEVMHATHTSHREGRFVEIAAQVRQPPRLDEPAR